MLDRATPLLDLMEGQRRAERGMSLAGSCNEDARDRFKSQALQAIITLARTQQYIFVDDLVGMIEAKPPSPNCWGGVWQRAINANIISKTSMRRKTAQPQKHAHEYVVYESLLFTPA